MVRRTLKTIALLLFLAPPAALAQPHADHEQLGAVSFDTSCAPAVKADFNRAVALLHSFEFRAAMDGFNAVLTRDPDCAMAFWGIALGYWGNPFAGVKTGPLVESGRAAIQQGLSTGVPTPRERAYLQAVSQLFTRSDAASHRPRTLAYAAAMEQVQRDFPSDVEARIFYALAVNQTADPADKRFSKQLQAAGLLEPLWQQYPQHPGLPHYIIHAYDHPPLAERALDAARRYRTIAPSAPHALHMPSHTFTRLGYWKDSAATNVLSEAAAMRRGVAGEALHAMDYEIYAYLQIADDEQALALVQRAQDTASKLSLTAVGGAAPVSAGIYATSAIPARLALERGAWSEAAALAPKTSTVPYADAVTRFARALGMARSGRPADARADIEQLAALRDTLGQMNDPYWREQVDIQRRVALAWVALAEGRSREGLDVMRAAADAEDATDKAAISPGPLAPARELLGEMLLATGEASAALEAFQATMIKEPNRFRGLSGAAMAAEKDGNRSLALQLYRRLVQIASGGNASRPELQHAREFLETGGRPRPRR